MRRKIPSTHALACFEAAARHESYTRAAQELALTQSAVSRQISSLEAYLGVELFRRTRHGVMLTASGADYARQTGRLLESLERATLDAAALQGGGGTLMLGVVPTFATRWLLPRLPDLARRYPDITIHLETRTRPFLFADTDFDAAIYAGTPEQVANWPGTQATPLLREDVVPVCSPVLPGYRPGITPEELADFPLLQQSTRPYGWRQWFDAMGVAAPMALRGPRYELFSMTATAAAHCGGVALVPTILVQEELERGELVVACDRPLLGERHYYLVAPAQSLRLAPLAAFRSWLIEQTDGEKVRVENALIPGNRERNK